jgi:hypothetical protein
MTRVDINDNNQSSNNADIIKNSIKVEDNKKDDHYVQ